MPSKFLDKALNWQRDFKVPDVPGSTPNDPDKAEGRDALTELDNTINAKLTGLYNNRGTFVPAASSGASGYPTTGGSSSGGAIKKFDVFAASQVGYVTTQAVYGGDTVIANVDNPGQSNANWNYVAASTGSPSELKANKATSFTAPDDTKYPTAKLVKDSLDLKLNLAGGTMSGPLGLFGGIINALDVRVVTALSAIVDPAGNAPTVLRKDGTVDLNFGLATLKRLFFRARNFATLGHQMTSKKIPCYCVDAAPGWTWANVVDVESHFEWVRLVIPYDGDNAGGATIKACVATSSRSTGIIGSLDASVTPLKDDDTAETPTLATWTNGGLDKDIWEQFKTLPPPAAVTTGVTVPVDNTSQTPMPGYIAGGDCYPKRTFLYSDWVRCPSKKRKDVGERPILHMRTYQTGAPRPAYYAPNAGWVAQANAFGRVFRDYKQNVDGVTNPTAFTKATVGPVAGCIETTQCATPIFQVMSLPAGVPLMIIGDSKTQGFGTNYNMCGPVALTVAALSSLTLPIYELNCGEVAMDSDGFLYNGNAMLASIGFFICIIEMASQNQSSVGYSTPELARTNWARTNAAINRVRKLGGVPIIMTDPASADVTGADEANRQTILALARASGELVLDVDRMLTDYSGPAPILNPAYTNDDVHPNDAGATLIAHSTSKTAPGLISIVKKILAK